MKRTPIATSLALSLAALSAGAQQAPQPTAVAEGRQRLVEVTPEGAFLRETLAPGVVSTGGVVNLTTPGLLWTHTDGGQLWIGEAVSIGNLSSQVFTEFDLNNEAAALFSAYDGNPATPVWTDSTLGTEFRDVASADATDTHVAVHQIVLNSNIQTRQAVVRKYTSSSPTPDWTYTFAPIINAGSRVGISRDGQTIVAAIFNNNTSEVEIAVFGPNSGTPVSYTTFPVPGSMRGFDLSADGSTLYFSAGVIAHVFDVATTSVIFTTSIGASFDSHAISGDGSVFAFGNFNLIRIWERSGGTYTNTFTRTLAGQNFVAEIDISDDSSTVAYGFTFYSNYLPIQVEAIDVPTKTITMTDTQTGAGSSQNIVSGVSISADGQHFGVGLWGDDAGLVAEMRLYNRGQNAPVATFNTPGSIFGVEISADGQRMVGGSKAVHANQFGNGGRIDLLDRGGEDFIVRGTPSIGSTIQFELHGTPGETGVLLEAPFPAMPPMQVASAGILYIDRNTLLRTVIGTIPAGGVLTSPLIIPNNIAVVGIDRYYQGVQVAPAVLTQDWVKLTFLP